VNPETVFFVANLLADPAGAWSWNVTLPPPPLLDGFQVAAQAVFLDPIGSPGLALTNGLGLTFR
jgi:hypothetical protein